MEKQKKQGLNNLNERMVRNEDIFCSLLFDQVNRTLRVVDFRGGNFQSKHNYLERVLMSEGMRKIFTLIERDDMNGWQRVGYQREGSIPGYYKRSDAYIMSRIYDGDFDADAVQGEESAENKKFLNDVKTLGKDFPKVKTSGIKVEQIAESEVVEAIENELKRREAKVKTKKKGKASPAKKKSSKASSSGFPSITMPVFPQFSREVEHHYFLVQNRRTKQANILGAEYQDCFGNAKVDYYFTPESRTDHNLARTGMNITIDLLAELGAVAIFAMGSLDDFETNALYASAGFRNTGWLTRQLLTEKGPTDVILWTKKLI
jgi:hypothetical protein